MRSFHQPTGTFTIYDPGFPRTFPDTSTPVRSAMVIFEENIRRDAVETGAFFAVDGRLLLQHIGDAHQVGFTQQEMLQMRHAYFTHNHPGDLTFSVEDIILASEINLVEVRAVTPLCRHIMEPVGVWPAPDVVNAAFNAELAQAKKLIDTELISGLLAVRHAFHELHHRAWVRVAANLHLKYVREAS